MVARVAEDEEQLMWLLDDSTVGSVELAELATAGETGHRLEALCRAPCSCGSELLTWRLAAIDLALVSEVRELAWEKVYPTMLPACTGFRRAT